MEIIIEEDVIWWKNCMDLLYGAANRSDGSIKELQGFRKFFKGYREEEAKAEEMYWLAEKLRGDFRVSYYFESFKENQLNCLARCLIETFAPQENCGFEELGRRAQEEFERYSLEEFPAFSGSDWKLDLQEERRPFLESVRRMELEEKFKARLIFAFTDFRNSIREILELLRKADLLLQPYREQIREEGKHFKKYWEKRMDGCFLEKMGVGVDDHAYRRMRVTPTAVNRAVMRIGIEEETSGEELNIEIGLGLTEDIIRNYLEEKNQNPETVMESLRLLADPGKLGILLYIKDEAHYGKEIAEQFQLTAATISYHMEELYQKGLILIRQQGKRIYYSANRERIGRVLDAAKEILL